MLCSSYKRITVGARPSPLSREQHKEVELELKLFYPNTIFSIEYVLTIGDREKQISLRTLGQTDFFTKDIDEKQLKSEFQIAIHSAKDLPVPLTKGLKIVALTRGMDPSDSLVFREKDSLYTLPSLSKIATSSLRREEIVKSLRSDLTFTDIRGNMGERLDQLWDKKVDAVVVAECALIRLKLTHLNRMKLPGETAAHQGQLAIIAREDDQEMENIFQCIDSRR